MAAVIATQLTTPDTTRAYTVTVGSTTDLTGDVYFGSVAIEDQGTNVQATTGFEVRGITLASVPNLKGQALLEIYDHVSASLAFRGFVDSHDPDRRPGGENVIAVSCSDHTSLLDNIIPFEARPAGEGDQARLGYLWGKYAGSYLNADFSQVQSVSASLPAQQFAGISLRQAIDMIAAQASVSAFWYLDRAGRLHYGTSESNDAPYDITSDTPGAGEISAKESLRIDWDSKNYTQAVYVRGKNDAGSGWVSSESGKLNHGGLVRTRFLDAPDCTTAAMRNALANMYLGRLNAAKARGSFVAFSGTSDGWRAGQNVTVRSSHHNVNQAWRIARVRTSVIGTAAQRRYDVEFGNAAAGSDGGLDPPIVMGQTLTGDLVDDNGSLLLSSSPNAFSGGLGPAVRRYITSGVYNGDFALAPPLPEFTIVDSYNPLPFWSFASDSGTSITATSIADSASGSGRLIRLQMDAGGSAGDSAYIEQIIPINSSRTQTFYINPRCTVLTESSTSVAKVWIDAQFLLADGTTTTGTAGTYEATTASIGASALADITATPNDPAPPTDAAFLRVRFGLKRDAAATSVADSVLITEASLSIGNVRVWVADGSNPSTRAPFRILQSAGIAYLQANYSAPIGSAPGIALIGTTASNPVVGFQDSGGNAESFRVGGTSFPSSPATHDVFYRTDLCGWYRYSGSAWIAATTIDYVQKTSNTSVTATTEGTANTVVTATATTFDGATRIQIEFYAPDHRPDNTGANNLNLILVDGSTVLGIIASTSGQTTESACHVFRVLTPSAAAHTYSIRAYVNAGTGVVYGGAGGTGGAMMPAFIRISPA